MTGPRHAGYVHGTEQFVAAVWYVMKDAERSYEKNRLRLERGRLGSWFYLTKIRKALGLESQHVPYSLMRQELLEFASKFGVEGPALDLSTKDQQAAKEFQ